MPGQSMRADELQMIADIVRFVAPGMVLYGLTRLRINWLRVGKATKRQTGRRQSKSKRIVGITREKQPSASGLWSWRSK